MMLIGYGFVLVCMLICFAICPIRCLRSNKTKWPNVFTSLSDPCYADERSLWWSKLCHHVESKPNTLEAGHGEYGGPVVPQRGRCSVQTNWNLAGSNLRCCSYNPALCLNVSWKSTEYGPIICSLTPVESSRWSSMLQPGSLPAIAVTWGVNQPFGKRIRRWKIHPFQKITLK